MVIADPDWSTAQVRTLDDLGEALRGLRRRQARRTGTPELTVRELSRRSGYAYGVISEYLSGKALAPTDRFDVLIRLLDAGPAEQRTLATARDRLEEQRRARRAAGGVPRQLPPDVSAFTGRVLELAALDDGGPGIWAVVGTPGVGKTALAVHWAHRAEARYPDGCLYVDLRGYDPDQPVPPAEALASFLRALGVPGIEIPPTEAERAARYRTRLADRRMLVVLDNARDTDHVRLLLPGGAGCRTLVTSRDALTGLVARHGARRLDLDPLADADAVALLGALLGRRVADEPQAARALAARCARLPLSLRLAAELAGTRPDVSLGDLDAELADLRLRLDALDAGGEPRTASRAVFSWSYHHLRPPARYAFRLFGLAPVHHIDAYALAALTGTDLDSGAALLRELSQAHLVQASRPGAYAMHDLLRAYATELADGDPERDRRAALGRLREYQLYASATAMDVIAAFDRDRRPKVSDPGWPVPPLSDVDTATRWLDGERSNLVATALYHVDCYVEPVSHSGTLAGILVRYLDTGAHHHDAELLYRHAAATAPPVERANALTSLGIVDWRLGRYHEAAGHLEQALDLAGGAGAEAEQGRALLGLGIVYWHLGDLDGTLHSGQQALDLYRRTGDEIGQARVLGNLANVHRRLGNYPEALAYGHEALEIFRAVGDPAGTANVLCSSGAVLEVLGRLDEALAALTEAHAVAMRIGYLGCATVILGNLGIVYGLLGRLDEAYGSHQQALALVQTTGDRTSEGYARGYLGSLYEQMGRYADAVDEHLRALGLARELGDEHLACELRNRLGDALLGAGRPHRALRAYRRALVLTLRHHDTYQRARADHGLARALTALGHDELARPHRERALSAYRRLGVPVRPEGAS